MSAVTNKAAMYQLLSEGAFGNTIAQFFSVEDWQASADRRRFPLWGVRTLTPGGPCRLNCPSDEVAAVFAQYTGAGQAANISAMVSAVYLARWMGDVFEDHTGLRCYGIEYPRQGLSWRLAMPVDGVETRGLAARQLLRRHLNASSLADLEAVLECWPGHVVELTAFDCCVGQVPGRNAVIWEVRYY